MWEFQKEKEGVYTNPNNEIVYNRTGLLFHPEHNLLLVADGQRKRMLIMDPGSGSLIQNIDLPHIGIDLPDKGRVYTLGKYNQ